MMACFAIALVLVFLLVVNSSSKITEKENDLNLTDIAFKISNQYDLSHPPQYKKPVANQNHGKRCALQNPESALFHYKQKMWQSRGKGYDIIVQSPCIGADSLGNYLGNYFEVVLCANITGLHYIAVGKVWQPEDDDKPTAFISHLPSIISHPSPTSSYDETIVRMIQYCKCPGSCHERTTSLWPKGLSIINPILHNALAYHISQDTLGLFQHTLITASDKSTVPVGTILPFIPDVAIHYRCGDNFIGHYGFVPFVAFSKFIPSSVKTIYVLSEAKGRKTAQKQHMEQKCSMILDSFFQYLQQQIPRAIIVLRRGDDLYADFARLVYSPILICSVSTFCLWPAVMNNGSAVYFPKTKLILGGDTSVLLGTHFHWFDTPAVVKGARYEHQPVQTLLNVLVNTAS